MAAGDTVSISSFAPARAVDASRMLSRAFVTNPLHVAAFGASRLDRNRAFFLAGLAVMRGPTFVATDGDAIVGLVHWVPSTHCQLSTTGKLQLVPTMIGGFGIRSTIKVASWLSAWATHDPKEPHVHLGPIGVDPKAQGQGIGRRLMEHYCDAVDRTSATGYLETDRPANVAFYRQFGFVTTEEITVLGVPNILMRRAPR
jgi:ribosomal protein S18 acetylase RimI-like enzyme